MDSFAPLQTLAAGTILAASDNTLATSEVRGCAIARTGAGVYTLTKAPGLPGQSIWPVAKELVHAIGVRTLTITTLDLVRTSDTVLTINSQAGGVATDCDLSFEIKQLVTAT